MNKLFSCLSIKKIKKNISAIYLDEKTIDIDVSDQTKLFLNTGEQRVYYKKSKIFCDLGLKSKILSVLETPNSISQTVKKPRKNKTNFIVLYSSLKTEIEVIRSNNIIVENIIKELKKTKCEIDMLASSNILNRDTIIPFAKYIY